MLDPTRTRRAHYEDLLRAIGHYLDDRGLSYFSIMEVPQGFIVKGRILVDALERDYYSAPQAHLVTNEEIEELIENARRRRGQADAEPAQELRAP